MEPQKIQNAQEFLKDLTANCRKNKNFKNQLLNNPKTTIEEFIGKKISLPEGKVLMVEDQTDNSFVYLNIPRKPDLDNLELTDEQLENVAGGAFPYGPIALAIAVIRAVDDICQGAYDAGAQCKM